jgi:hypothetical protein
VNEIRGKWTVVLEGYFHSNLAKVGSCGNYRLVLFSLSSPSEQSFFSTLGLGGTDEGGETAHSAGSDINSWFDSIAGGESHPGGGGDGSSKSASASADRTEDGEFTAAQDRYFDEVLKTYGPQAEKLAEVRLGH